MRTRDRLEAHEDEREFRVRMTGTPWAQHLAELVNVAQGVLYEGTLMHQLGDVAAQLESCMARRQDVSIESARLVLGLCWRAEMERETRVTRSGARGRGRETSGSGIPSARGANPASGPAACDVDWRQ